MNNYLQRLVDRHVHAVPEVHSIAKLPYVQMPSIEQSEAFSSVQPISPQQTKVGPRITPSDQLYEQIDQSEISEFGSKTVLYSEEKEFTAPTSVNKEQTYNPPTSVAEKKEKPVHMDNELYSVTKQGQVEQTLESTKISTFDQKNGQNNDGPFIPLVKIVPEQGALISQPKLKNPQDKQTSGLIKPISAVNQEQGKLHSSAEEPYSDSNEVHVTIGRIEITAVHAPPASRNTSTPVRKPMSLDEYLAKKNGERL